MHLCVLLKEMDSKNRRLINRVTLLLLRKIGNVPAMIVSTPAHVFPLGDEGIDLTFEFADFRLLVHF